MSDDFGTVNVRRGDRAREIETLRQHYRAHRDTLGQLMANAPTEHLATEYQRLIDSIDDSLRKLDDLEGRPGVPPHTTHAGRVVVPPSASVAAAAAAAAAAGSAGTRPLSGTTPPPFEPVTEPMRYEAPQPSAGSRTAIIVVVGVLVLAAIGYLIWRASSEKRADKTSTVVEQPVTSSPDTAAPVTPAPATSTTSTVVPVATGGLKINPALQDYGVIRKGTRAVRQFEATNTGSAPIDIVVPRSACRCLFYEYKARIAPGAKERITVTVDGAKAKPGALEEQLAVTAKKDPSVSATITVRAAIQ